NASGVGGGEFAGHRGVHWGLRNTWWVDISSSVGNLFALPLPRGCDDVQFTREPIFDSGFCHHLRRAAYRWKKINKKQCENRQHYIAVESHTSTVERVKESKG